jgi:hypothetical protein
LVSIAPETRDAGLEEYKAIIDNNKISDFKHEKSVMEVTFTDGTVYEYFGVNEKLVAKFYNSDKQFRFAKRQIFHSFLYRKAKKEDVMA